MVPCLFWVKISDVALMISVFYSYELYNVCLTFSHLHTGGGGFHAKRQPAILYRAQRHFGGVRWRAQALQVPNGNKLNAFFT